MLTWVFGFDADNNRDWTPGFDSSIIVTYNKTGEPQWSLVSQLANETRGVWSSEFGVWNAGFGTSDDISDIHPILEMRIPLDLIGVNGSEGGTVGFILAYIVIAGGEWVYINLWPSTAKWTDDNGTPVEGAIATWGDLVISAGGGPPPPPTEGEGLPIWVWPTVAVVVIVIIIVAVYMLRR